MQVLILGAILTEAIVENVKTAFVDREENAFLRTAILIISVLVAWLMDINIFDFLNITVKYHIAGVIITGILFARGSNYIHDFIDRVGDYR